MSRAMTEASFQSAVVDLAHLYNYRCAHFRPAQTARGWKTPVGADGAGWPDLVLVRPGRLVFAELKSATGRVRPEQLVWLDELKSAGAEVHVWRPDDWDEIVEVLR